MDPIERILHAPGRLDAEVESFDEDLRAFVTVTSFFKSDLPDGDKRYGYFPKVDLLFKVTRYRVFVDLLEEKHGISKWDVCDLDEVVVPDKGCLLEILEMWLPSLDALVAPELSDAPI